MKITNKILKQKFKLNHSICRLDNRYAASKSITIFPCEYSYANKLIKEHMRDGHRHLCKGNLKGFLGNVPQDFSHFIFHFIYYFTFGSCENIWKIRYALNNLIFPWLLFLLKAFSGFDIKLHSVMRPLSETLESVDYLSLDLLQGPLWPGVVVPVRVPSLGLRGLFEN